MIRPAPARKKPLLVRWRTRRRTWRRTFVLLPRTVRDETSGRQVQVFFDWIERRWSTEHRCWLWRVPKGRG